MTRKILFGALAIALAFGMMVTGCETADEDGFENHTLNLTSAEENNTILLTLKGAVWKDPTSNSDDLENAAKQKVFQEALLDRLLEWTQTGGNISSIKTTVKLEFKLEKENVIKITFSKIGALGAGFNGSAEVKLKEYSSPELRATLEFFTESMELGVWTIGKNKEVPITIPK